MKTRKLIEERTSPCIGCGERLHPMADAFERVDGDKRCLGCALRFYKDALAERDKEVVRLNGLMEHAYLAGHLAQPGAVSGGILKAATEASFVQELQAKLEERDKEIERLRSIIHSEGADPDVYIPGGLTKTELKAENERLEKENAYYHCGIDNTVEMENKKLKAELEAARLVGLKLGACAEVAEAKLEAARTRQLQLETQVTRGLNRIEVERDSLKECEAALAEREAKLEAVRKWTEPRDNDEDATECLEEIEAILDGDNKQ